MLSCIWADIIYIITSIHRPGSFYNMQPLPWVNSQKVKPKGRLDILQDFFSSLLSVLLSSFQMEDGNPLAVF